MRELEREASCSKQEFAKSSKEKDRQAIHVDKVELPKGRTKQTARKRTANWLGDDDSDSSLHSAETGNQSAQNTKLEGTKPRTEQTARKSGWNWLGDDNSKPQLDSTTQIPGTNVGNRVDNEALLKSTKKVDTSFDVTGTWDIDCPSIENEWPCESMTLDLYLKKVNNQYQLFGFFDFGVLERILRFEKPTPISRSTVKTEASETVPPMQRKWDDDDSDDDAEMRDVLDYDDETRQSKYEEKSFYLSAKDKPTVRRPVWRCRWRGEGMSPSLNRSCTACLLFLMKRYTISLPTVLAFDLMSRSFLIETGERVIELNMDKILQHIKFSNKGNMLSGTFQSNLTGSTPFTGTKMSSQSGSRLIDPTSTWAEYGEHEYERRRQSRWGGGRW